ncbi:MAG: OmpA family protein [Deltaproteobacteria bacterium]|nr:OmpA family protein [Deltaproteobacteria bacterium]
MNRLFRPTIVAALAAGLALTTTTAARANVEIGGTAGIHVFSDNNELGVSDTPDATSERNSALFGLRLGIFFGDMIGIEGEFGVIPSEPRKEVHDLWNLAYRASLVVQFRAEKPENKMIPFILFGGGGMSLVDNSDAGALITKDDDAMLHVGIGAKFRVDNGWGLRADARMYFPPSSEDDGFTQDFEFLLSIYKEFGRTPYQKIEEQVVTDNDPDRDGIIGDLDKCPTEPEDKDSFEDENGCPDPDNDADGILDSNDKCPLEPEDKDGFEDDNGCPDPDNDGDGILDGFDQCPLEPEDKDGFEDENGCPDNDNDADGIPDGVDKCPMDPETKNGFDDGDGCPDTIPDKVKKFSGSIQGINFKVNSADLLPASNKVLDQAVAVLVEFKDVKLEIQGHTDDQPLKAGPKAKFKDNTELSQARAESVRAYFVKKGIDASRLDAKGFGESAPLEPVSGLKGAKLNAARVKNRRVEFKLVSSIGAPAAPVAPPTPGAETP